VSAAGGSVLGPMGEPLDYDVMEDVLNPYFLVTSDDRWTTLWVDAQA